ncbi:DUF1523 domain-containing protein [Clostridium sp.]|uniref:DUF1523 domain-containing protein n=1 Tax=Clostridium sp. TaxID=1506 RepID=UPI001A3FA198|nr:DUF1523 domain-containing protein [Clostridium sp.]MBK5242639.1 DUF1523 domain-containing protein [Clostridium sp.]
MIGNIDYQFKRINFMKFKIKKIIIIVIVMIGVSILFPHFIRSTYIVTIANKRVVKRDNIDTYLIYTQTENGDIRIFNNTNSLLEFKIHSEDLYWGIIINRKYEVKAYGVSIPLLSYYQNVISVKGVSTDTK